MKTYETIGTEAWDSHRGQKLLRRVKKRNGITSALVLVTLLGAGAAWFSFAVGLFSLVTSGQQTALLFWGVLGFFVSIAIGVPLVIFAGLLTLKASRDYSKFVDGRIANAAEREEEASPKPPLVEALPAAQ